MKYELTLVHCGSITSAWTRRIVTYSQLGNNSVMTAVQVMGERVPSVSALTAYQTGTQQLHAPIA